MPDLLCGCRQLGWRQRMVDGEAGRCMYFRERAECGGVAAAPAFAVDQVNARRAWPERLLSRTSIAKLSTLSVEFFFKLLTRSNPQALKFLFDRAYLAVNKRKMAHPGR